MGGFNRQSENRAARRANDRPRKDVIIDGGERGIRTPVGRSQQIYSLPPLATRAPHREEVDVRFLIGAHDGTRIRDLFLTKEVLYQLSYMGTRCRTRRHYVQFPLSSKYARLRRLITPLIFPCQRDRAPKGAPAPY